MHDPLNEWRGGFGDAYAARNPATLETLRRKTRDWARMLAPLQGRAPSSILEVGANVGQNIRALAQVSDARLYAVEPNPNARKVLAESGAIAAADVFDGTAQKLPFDDASIDLVFTSGVLIHVPPASLPQACAEIHRVAKRYILCVEYFADQPIEKKYQDRDGMLFLRDFGAFYLDAYPGLEVVDFGFLWRKFSGDSLNWWLMEKPAA